MSLSTFDHFKKMNAASCIALQDSDVRELQQVLLRMLDDFLSLCNEFHIGYSLGGGSVLGAVRHKGFIPWDDDVDINMTRAEYERFVPLFRKYLSEKYWLQLPEDTSGYEVLFARMRKKGTSVRTRDDFFSQEAGAFIDIFIIENTFDNVVLRNLHGLACQATGFLLSCRKFYRARSKMIQLAKGNTRLLGVFLIKIGVGFVISPWSLDTWRLLAVKCCQLCQNSSSRYVTIPAGRKRFYGECFKREVICETVPALFEGRECLIPKQSDEYLSRLYGDYHKIPSLEDREAHIYFEPFYIGEENYE